MKLFLSCISLMLALCQGIMAYVWVKSTRPYGNEYSNFLELAYGHVPAWTEFAFSIGAWWFGIAVLTGVMVLSTYLCKASWLLHLVAFFWSLTMALALLYAMYPIHLMMNGGLV